MSRAIPKCNKKRETIRSTEIPIVRFNNGGRPLMAVILKATKPFSIILYERQSDL